MTLEQLTKYFKNAVIIPGILIVLFYVAFGIFNAIFGQEYQSEWIAKGDVIFLSIFIVILNAMFIAFLTTPMFLNQIPQVRSNTLISILCWLFCPLIWIAYLLSQYYSYLTNFSHKFDGESLFTFSNTIPYLFGLIWSFVKFQNDLKTKNY